MDTAKPIPTSRQETDMSSKEVATTKMPATHTPNRRATRMPHSPLRHNRTMGADSNKGVTRTDMGKLRQRMLAAPRIQPVQVRRAAATVRSVPRTFGSAELMITSWRQ